MNPDNINTGRGKIEELRRQGAIVIDSPWTEADLSRLGLAPDIILPQGIDFNHRHDSAADIYFLCNTTDRTITFAPRCRATGSRRYLHDTMDNTITTAGDSITLTPHASVFLIVTDEVCPEDMLTPQDEALVARQHFNRVAEVTGMWQLTFEENGARATSDLSTGWEQHDDPAIKYFSGHVSYENTFKYKGKGKVWIHLEEVHDIATVYVNGVCCGTTWFAPHRVDITKAVKRGKNKVRIEVVNTWANALLGADNGTPPYDGIWTNAKYRRAEKNLLPAGLLKGVYIEK